MFVSFLFQLYVWLYYSLYTQWGVNSFGLRCRRRWKVTKRPVSVQITSLSFNYLGFLRRRNMNGFNHVDLEVLTPQIGNIKNGCFLSANVQKWDSRKQFFCLKCTSPGNINIISSTGTHFLRKNLCKLCKPRPSVWTIHLGVQLLGGQRSTPEHFLLQGLKVILIKLRSASKLFLNYDPDDSAFPENSHNCLSMIPLRSHRQRPAVDATFDPETTSCRREDLFKKLFNRCSTREDWALQLVTKS